MDTPPSPPQLPGMHGYGQGGHRAGSCSSTGQSSLLGGGLPTPKTSGMGKGAREITWGREPGLSRQSQRRLRAEPPTRAAASGMPTATDLQPRALPKAASHEPAVPAAPSTQPPLYFNPHPHPQSPPALLLPPLPPVAPGLERGRTAGFIPPQRCAGRAPAAAVISSLFSHHRPFLPRILNSEISVKVRARFADSLCRKHGGAGESKAFAAGRPFFGRRCSPLRDQLSFPKPRERFVPHLKPTAEIPQGWRFKGCGRRTPPDSPEN